VGEASRPQQPFLPAIVSSGNPIVSFATPRHNVRKLIVRPLPSRRLAMSRLNSIVVAICILLAGAFASAQQVHIPPAVAQSQGMDVPPVTAGDDIQKQQARAANLQRQRDIRRDTEKMAELTQELRDYLVKQDQGTMSVDAIKKAEQIEKLAHSVKSKMKQSF
jgi:hypothetical protein